MFNIFMAFFSKISEGNNSTTWLAIVMTAFMGWQTHQMKLITDTIVSTSFKSTTEYSYNVLKVGYHSVTTPSDVLSLTRKWKKNNNITEIAAIRTLCNEEPNRLHTLIHADTAKIVCRIIY